MNKNNKKDERLSISKVYVTIQNLMIWIGVIVGVITVFLPEFAVLGTTSKVLALPAGILTIAGLVIMLAGNTCPYCGSRKIGAAIGARFVKEVECPECNKKADIK